MATNKTIITPENSAEWLASCGFLFPSNERELARFNILFGSMDPAITGNEVDPFKIINRSSKVVKLSSIKKNSMQNSHYQMVAKRSAELPKHIIEKIGKHKKNRKGDAGNDEQR